MKAEDPDTGRTVEVCPANRLHGLQYNLELFRNRSLFHEGVDAAAEIFTRLSTKVQKILQSELDSVKKQVPTNMPSIVVSPASAPILFTEGVKIASDLKRGNNSSLFAFPVEKFCHLLRCPLSFLLYFSLLAYKDGYFC